MVNFVTPKRSSGTVKPDAELAEVDGINVFDGLPSKLGHNIPVKEESSAATANCSIFASELGTAIGCYYSYALLTDDANINDGCKRATDGGR